MNEYYSVIRKREFLPYATTWMNLEEIMIIKIRQIQKYKFCMVSLIHGILKKKKNQGNKVEWWLAGTGGGEMTTVKQYKPLTSSGHLTIYKIKKKCLSGLQGPP